MKCACPTGDHSLRLCPDLFVSSNSFFSAPHNFASNSPFPIFKALTAILFSRESLLFHRIDSSSWCLTSWSSESNFWCFALRSEATLFQLSFSCCISASCCFNLLSSVSVLEGSHRSRSQQSLDLAGLPSVFDTRLVARSASH